MRSTPGRAVELGPALLHGPGDVGVGGRALEDHVLEQVGHAGLAVALVPRADQDGQVDRDLGTGRVGEQEHAQAVIEPVLGDPLHARDLLGAGCAHGRRGGEQAQGRCQEPAGSLSAESHPHHDASHTSQRNSNRRARDRGELLIGTSLKIIKASLPARPVSRVEIRPAPASFRARGTAGFPLVPSVPGESLEPAAAGALVRRVAVMTSLPSLISTLSRLRIAFLGFVWASLARFWPRMLLRNASGRALAVDLQGSDGHEEHAILDPDVELGLAVQVTAPGQADAELLDHVR